MLGKRHRFWWLIFGYTPMESKWCNSVVSCQPIESNLSNQFVWSHVGKCFTEEEAEVLDKWNQAWFLWVWRIIESTSIKEALLPCLKLGSRPFSHPIWCLGIFASKPGSLPLLGKGAWEKPARCFQLPEVLQIPTDLCGASQTLRRWRQLALNLLDSVSDRSYCAVREPQEDVTGCLWMSLANRLIYWFGLSNCGKVNERALWSISQPLWPSLGQPRIWSRWDEMVAVDIVVHITSIIPDRPESLSHTRACRADTAMERGGSVHGLG